MAPDDFGLRLADCNLNALIHAIDTTPADRFLRYWRILANELPRTMARLEPYFRDELAR